METLQVSHHQRGTLHLATLQRSKIQVVVTETGSGMSSTFAMVAFPCKQNPKAFTAIVYFQVGQLFFWRNLKTFKLNHEHGAHDLPKWSFANASQSKRNYYAIGNFAANGRSDWDRRRNIFDLLDGCFSLCTKTKHFQSNRLFKFAETYWNYHLRNPEDLKAARQKGPRNCQNETLPVYHHRRVVLPLTTLQPTEIEATAAGGGISSMKAFPCD